MTATLTAIERPALARISESPRLYVADGFARDEEIEHILRRAESIERRRPEHMLFHQGDTGFSFEMFTQRDPVLLRLMEDTYSATGVRNLVDCSMRFRRYGAGNSHRGHLDVYEMKGYHLLVTAILYLDNVDGGETRFPRAAGGPIAIAPKRGRLAVWFNYTPEGEEDQASWHEGLVVRSGVKTTITNFMYNSLALSGTAVPAR
jgi:hypothetical protein